MFELIMTFKLLAIRELATDPGVPPYDAANFNVRLTASAQVLSMNGEFKIVVLTWK